METSEEGGTGTQAPSARHSGSIRGSVRSVGIQHKVKEEPEEETAHIWETQWQDFLNTVDVSPSPLQDPYFPPEDTPWDDARAFLASFEQVAKACRWPREEWVDRLRPALTGEAELTFSSLEDGDREDYGKVKAAILQEDVLGREKSRQRFRSFCYLEAVGPRGVYGRLRELCARWLKVEQHSKEQILEELVLEQFLAILPPEIQAWVKEHPLESSTQAVFLAEEFLRSQWVPEVKEEQMAQLHGAGPAHLPEDEGLPQNCGVGLRLLRESKAEELTDLSDTDLSADGGEVYEEHESHPEEPSPPRTLQVISLGRSSDNGPQLSHQQNGRREGRRSARRCAPKRSQDSICREAMKNTGRHACLVCGKSFTRKWTLKQHQIKHHPSHSREETLPQGVQAREDGRDKSDVESQQSASSGEHPCVCSHCGESFSSKILLVIHQSTHAGDPWPPSLPEVTLYICRECGETFDCLQDHDSHQETHSGQRPGASVEWEEGEGEEETETPSSPRPQGEEQPYICTDCGKSFVTRLWYKKHQVLHRRKKKALFFYNPKRKTCSICGSTFPNFWKLRQHQKSHQQTNPDRSAQGQSRFGQNRGLIKKGSVPQSEKAEPPPRREPGGPRKPYQCTHCERRFLTPANLVRHQSVHSAKRRYPCARCGRRFMTKRALCDHEKHCPRGKKLVPRLAPEPLTKPAPRLAPEPLAKPAPRLAPEPLAKVLSTTCPDCGKRFCSTSSMQRHRRMHSGEKFYRCEDCGKTFMWDSTYYTHRRKVHHWQAGAHPVRRGSKEKEKAYPCNQCGVTFKRASLLATHRCAPADKTQLVCTDCGRTFSNPSALERHQRNHRKKKPESPLRQRTQVGKKPFACAKCGRRFDFPWHLKLHQRIHLAVKPLKCTDCGERFLWPLCLFRHKKKAHGGVKKAPLSPDTPSVPQGALSRRNRGKRFAKQPDLVRHRRMHAAEKPLKRAACPKNVQGRFVQDRKDRRETQENPPGETVSVPKPKEFPCSVCGARFNTYPDLVSHRHVHGEGKLHKCTDCGKNFSQPSSLKRHWKEIHKRKKLVPVLHRIPDLEKKRFNCSEHEKRLHQPLEKPRYRITSEKGEALTCSVCGEQFTFRIGLVRHQAVHREVRRHTCGECGKKFIHLNNLLKHKRTHDGFQKLTLQVFGSDLQVTGSRSSPPPAVTVTHENSNGAPPLDSVEASRGPASVEEPPL